MTNFNTPQSKTVEKLFDAYASIDLNNIEPLLSKDFHYEFLPETPEVPKQTKESHLQMLEKIIPSVEKLEVCIRHRRTAFKFTDRHPLPLVHLSRSDRSTGEGCRPRSSLHTEPSHCLRL